jgi:hypothetical protein
MNIKTVEMELAVANFMYKKGAEAVISKTNFLYYEADILSVTKSHYLTEVELKVSKSDFLADFKKGHGHNSKLTKYLYYSVTSDLVELTKEKLDPNIGIIEVYRDHYRPNVVRCKVVRDAKIRSSKPLTDKQVMNLYRLGCYKEWGFKAKQK